MSSAIDRTYRVGICFADPDTFWWDASKAGSRVCPACSDDDEEYAANHIFYTAEDGGAAGSGAKGTSE